MAKLTKEIEVSGEWASIAILKDTIVHRNNEVNYRFNGTSSGIPLERDIRVDEDIEVIYNGVGDNSVIVHYTEL